MERNSILLALVLPAMAVAQPGNDDMLAGLSALRTADHASAERSFSDALAERPDDARAWYYRGVNRLTMGDAPGALLDLDRSLDLDPTNANSLLRRAEAHLMVGSITASIVDLERALALHPDGPLAEHALLQLGHLAMLNGDFEGANARFAEVCRIAPMNALGHCNRGIALATLHADTEALIALEKALEMDHTLDQAHVHRAIVLLRNDRAPEACVSLRHARELGDTSVDELLLIYCE